MTATQAAHTPIATSKTAALCRVLDVVPKGYLYYTAGTCTAAKAENLAIKFHALYGIGCSPAQRITRKKHGLANALLVMFWPSRLITDSKSASASASTLVSVAEAVPVRQHDQQPEVIPAELSPGALQDNQVSWLLLATEGSGAIHEQELLRSVVETPRLTWLGYELVRHASRGRARWTWRRTKAEMADWYALLGEQLNRRQYAVIGQSLLRISHQPGFSGVREQSWALCQFARSRGYLDDLPFLFYVQKVGHGVRLRVSPG
jgi:hypothetical protein